MQQCMRCGWPTPYDYLVLDEDEWICPNCLEEVCG